MTFDNLWLFKGSRKHRHQQTGCTQHHHPSGLSSSDITPCDYHPSQTACPPGSGSRKVLSSSGKALINVSDFIIF